MRIRPLTNWLDERLSISSLTKLADKKEVPLHRHSIWYYFGGMTLFLFVVQVTTGILLLLYYRPSAENAFESVQFIITEVKFGWLIRSIHSWSANLMIATLFIHMFSVFFLRAYHKPREITWVSGAVLLFIVICFGFSGYVLPWNKLAFFATKVGTEIAGVVPIVGHPVLRFLRGGDDVTGATQGDKGFVAAGTMRSRIDELIASIDKSQSILNLAERKGMEVSKPKFELKGATDALTHARVLIHSSSTTEVDKVIEPGMDVANKGYQAGVGALAELSFRRKGLAVSLLFILFLATLVYLKIRQIEARQQQTDVG